MLVHSGDKDNDTYYILHVNDYFLSVRSGARIMTNIIKLHIINKSLEIA